jgi:hypothetical protein
MDSRLIFLRRLQRFDPHACGFPRHIPGLVVWVGAGVSLHLDRYHRVRVQPNAGY